MKKIVTCALIFLVLTSISQAKDYDLLTIDETFTVDGPFDVELKVDAAEMDIRKNENDNECHVSIDYHSEYANVDVRFNDVKNRLEVIVDYENWKNVKTGYDAEGNTAPIILVELPANVIMEMDVKLKAGEFDLALGDLSIQSLELSNWAGECDIDFDLPNRIEMEVLDINFKVGELDIRNLGNARFSEADINSGIGELSIDFSGALLDRAIAKVDLDIGETTITVPENVGSKLRVSKFLFLSQVSYPGWFTKKGKYYYSENYNESNKNLYLMISSGIGELSIRVD